VGWVKNTSTGTVTGCLQGPEPRVRHMKDWLSKTGSPKSKIERCEFKEEKTIQAVSYQAFDIVRPKRKAKKR